MCEVCLYVHACACGFLGTGFERLSVVILGPWMCWCAHMWVSLYQCVSESHVYVYVSTDFEIYLSCRKEQSKWVRNLRRISSQLQKHVLHNSGLWQRDQDILIGWKRMIRHLPELPAWILALQPVSVVPLSHCRMRFGARWPDTWPDKDKVWRLPSFPQGISCWLGGGNNTDKIILFNFNDCFLFKLRVYYKHCSISEMHNLCL
jgi:hypothetical protein